MRRSAETAEPVGLAPRDGLKGNEKLILLFRCVKTDILRHRSDTPVYQVYTGVFVFRRSGRSKFRKKILPFFKGGGRVRLEFCQ